MGHRHDVGTHEVTQDVARADRRQLVGIPDEHEVRPVLDRRHQRPRQRGVAHGHLVAHDQVVGQPFVTAVPEHEPARGHRAGLEQPVHGGRGVADELLDALGGPPRRGAQRDVRVGVQREPHDLLDGAGLARARATGEDADGVLERRRDGGALAVGELGVEVGVAWRPGGASRRAAGPARRPGRARRACAAGVDTTGTGSAPVSRASPVTTSSSASSPPATARVDALGRQHGVDLQQASRRGHGVGACQDLVAVLTPGGAHGRQRPGREASGVRRRDPELAGEGVRLREAGTLDVQERVGVLAQDVRGVRAEVAVGGADDVGGDLRRRQELVEPGEGRPFGPGRPQARRRRPRPVVPRPSGVRARVRSRPRPGRRSWSGAVRRPPRGRPRTARRSGRCAAPRRSTA